MPWLSPYLIVQDPESTIEFYRKAFGFEFLADPIKNEDGTIGHAELKYQDAVIMLGKQGAFGGTTKSPANSGVESPVGLYVYVNDVDAFTAKAKKAGAKVTAEPEDQFWGDRMSKIVDPEGYTWTFATNVGECQVS